MLSKSSLQIPLLRYLSFFARVVVRTSTGLLLLLLTVSLTTVARSVAASRLRIVWTGGVPIASFCFVGAAATDQSRCRWAALGKDHRSEQDSPSRYHYFSSASGRSMHSVAGNSIPNERAVAKDMRSRHGGIETRDMIDSEDAKALLNEELLKVSPSSEVRSNVRKHFVFLIHGWLGNDMEMSYIEGAVEKAISSSPLLVGDEVKNEAETGLIVVHKVTCNNGKTADGIAAGGSRLADEILETIRSHMDQYESDNSVEGYENRGEMEESTQSIHHVTFSIVGNSLGGLYARYALSIIPAQLGKIVVHPNIFCTTATPHLGVASHTYVPIPRVAERVIGRGMGLTGRDLFRLDPLDGNDRDLIYRMSTEESFLGPLSKFEKRIAYANAFRTDFQVPTDTAAFLSSLSTYPHRLDRTYKEEFVATILHTERHDWRKFDTVFRESSMEHDILTMSTKLDSLGWTKVFVDVRERIPMPSVRLPGMRRRNSRSELNEFVAERRESGAFNETGVLIESRELVTLMNPTERLHFPLGHTVMVANSKSDWYAKLNEQGKPVMDMLASGLVEDMLVFGHAPEVNEDFL